MARVCRSPTRPAVGSVAMCAPTPASAVCGASLRPALLPLQDESMKQQQADTESLPCSCFPASAPGAYREEQEKAHGSPHQYGSLGRTEWTTEAEKQEDEVVSMADSTITVDDIEGELLKIERIRDILVRRESELRYMMDDIQLCKEITRLKKELQKLVSIPDKDKSNEDRQKEEELLQQIQKLVETRDFLVDDVEFERLREKEEDKEMADFLKSKFPQNIKKKGVPTRRRVRAQQASSPFTKTGLTLLKECCGFTCSIM